MAKLADGNSDSNRGSSFHGTVINTTVSKLRKAVGDPQGEYNDGSDKCNFDWECETDNGTPFTIYDWKQYREISEDENIEFHIGGYNKIDTEIAKDELLLQLK